MSNALGHCGVVTLVLICSTSAVGETAPTFRSLDACLASEAQTKAEADRAETVLGAIVQPLSQAFTDALTQRNNLLSRLSDIRSACSKLRIAANANSGRLGKEPMASQASQMNELHELLTDNVLKAVPDSTTRKIQEKNLGTVRSQMADLAKIMDNSITEIGSPVSGGGLSKGSTTKLVGRPDPAVGGVLGADAAAALTADVQAWKVQEAQRQEQIRLAESAQRAEQARIAAEQERIAQARYQAQLAAAKQERQRRSSAADNFLSGALSLFGVAAAIKYGGSSGASSSYESDSYPQTSAQTHPDSGGNTPPLNCLSYVDNHGNKVGYDAPGCVRH